MDYLILALTALSATASSVFGRLFNLKVKEFRARTQSYNLIMVTAAFICWLVAFLFDRSFDCSVLWYSALFGLGFFMACAGYLYAIRYGSVALSALFSKFSLIGATVWGFFFWETKVTVISVIGLCLASISVFFCVYKKEKGNINFKWLFFALTSFLGNVICTVVQKEQQIDFSHRFGNFFMMSAMLFALLLSLGLYLKSRGDATPKNAKTFSFIPVFSGGANYLMNTSVILLTASTLNPSFIYPTISVLSISLTTFASVFLFKEKPTRFQWVGIILGTAACVILSL